MPRVEAPASSALAASNKHAEAPGMVVANAGVPRIFQSSDAGAAGVNSAAKTASNAAPQASDDDYDEANDDDEANDGDVEDEEGNELELSSRTKLTKPKAVEASGFAFFCPLIERLLHSFIYIFPCIN